jgi:hypothetical protein
MDTALRTIVRVGWFVAVILIVAELLYQLKTSPRNDGLVFVVLWALITPLLKLPNDERRWEVLSRGLLGGVVVWILSSIRSHTIGQQPHTAMALFTAGVLTVAIMGSFLQWREDRRARL